METPTPLGNRSNLRFPAAIWLPWWLRNCVRVVNDSVDWIYLVAPIKVYTILMFLWWRGTFMLIPLSLFGLRWWQLCRRNKFIFVWNIWFMANFYCVILQGFIVPANRVGGRHIYGMDLSVHLSITVWCFHAFADKPVTRLSSNFDGWTHLGIP